MKATLTVKKSDLRTKLVSRIEEAKSRFDANDDVIKLRQALVAAENGETLEGFAKRMAEYHREVAEGLDVGRITLTETGRLSGAPEKPKRGRLDYNYYYHWSEYDLRRQLRYHEQKLTNQIKPLEAAIELLDMASGGTIEIDTADYHNLLSGNNDRY